MRLLALREKRKKHQSANRKNHVAKQREGHSGNAESPQTNGSQTNGSRTNGSRTNVCKSRSMTRHDLAFFIRNWRARLGVEILIGIGLGAGVIFKHSGFKILIIIYTVRNLWQESNRSRAEIGENPETDWSRSMAFFVGFRVESKCVFW